MDGAMSADVTASIANDAVRLPAGSAIVVDDFHTAAPAVSADMTSLVERWRPTAPSGGGAVGPHPQGHWSLVPGRRRWNSGYLTTRPGRCRES
jgi:hypothetical protein